MHLNILFFSIFNYIYEVCRHVGMCMKVKMPEVVRGLDSPRELQAVVSCLVRMYETEFWSLRRAALPVHG